MLDQGTPDGARQAMPDQQMPEPIGALVQVAHRQISQHRASIVGAPPPDGAVRKQSLITPGVASIQMLAGHLLGLEYDMGGIVPVPVTMQDASLRLELAKQRRARIGRQNMKRRALQAVGLNPLHRSREYIRPVVVEAEHEAAIHLNAIAM